MLNLRRELTDLRKAQADADRQHRDADLPGGGDRSRAVEGGRGRGTAQGARPPGERRVAGAERAGGAGRSGRRLARNARRQLTWSGRRRRRWAHWPRLTRRSTNWRIRRKSCSIRCPRSSTICAIIWTEIEFNPKRLDEVEERLDLIHSLARKYGGSIPAVIAYGADARKQLETITGAAERIDELELEEAKLLNKLAQQGGLLERKAPVRGGFNGQRHRSGTRRLEDVICQIRGGFSSQA
ncbi:MAG: hypothetical protein MZV64_17140 [Ignavibacteriales bacterium]|nr:hypothetical protein [Ignavibacteriales bacterium]